MPYLPSDNVIVELDKRYYTTGYGYFGFVALAIIIVLCLICAANSRRIKRGQNPYISQYLSPPTYMEAQGNNGGQAGAPENVPMYYQNANPNQDAGYYDANGNFVPSNKPLSPGSGDYQANVQQAYLPNQTTENMYQTNGPVASPSTNNYTRPDGPPPGHQSTAANAPSTDAAAAAAPGGKESSSVGFQEQPPAFEDVVNSTTYQRPSSPPPNRS